MGPSSRVGAATHPNCYHGLWPNAPQLESWLLDRGQSRGSPNDTSRVFDDGQSKCRPRRTEGVGSRWLATVPQVHFGIALLARVCAGRQPFAVMARVSSSRGRSATKFLLSRDQARNPTCSHRPPVRLAFCAMTTLRAGHSWRKISAAGDGEGRVLRR